MEIVTSPWRGEFKRIVSSARSELRVVAPFYGEEAVKEILKLAGEAVSKCFVFALSERALKANSQSTAAIEMIRNDGSCRIRFVENLHAKFMVADKKTAVVTSSNLTRAGLDGNFEMGVLIDDSKAIRKLICSFDDLWLDAEEIDSATLREFAKLEQNGRGGGGRGRVFGSRKTFAKARRNPPSPSTPAPGWIVIHSHQKYGGKGQFPDPQSELRDEFYPGVHWNWTLPKPLKERGPYRILLAWNKEVFGEATANVTRDIGREWRKEYRFAFVLLDYKPLLKPIPFKNLSLGKRERWHRSLIRLDSQILAAYDRFAS